MGKSCEREIFRPIEVLKTAEYCMYPQGVCRIRKPAYAGNGCAIFPVFDTEEWMKKIRSRPQAIDSEVPWWNAQGFDPRPARESNGSRRRRSFRFALCEACLERKILVIMGTFSQTVKKIKVDTIPDNSWFRTGHHLYAPYSIMDFLNFNYQIIPIMISNFMLFAQFLRHPPEKRDAGDLSPRRGFGTLYRYFGSVLWKCYHSAIYGLTSCDENVTILKREILRGSDPAGRTRCPAADDRSRVPLGRRF